MVNVGSMHGIGNGHDGDHMVATSSSELVNVSVVIGMVIFHPVCGTSTGTT